MKEQELLFYVPCDALFIKIESGSKAISDKGFEKGGWFGERIELQCKLPKGHTGMHSSKKPPEAD